jgi:hypothetical protein
LRYAIAGIVLALFCACYGSNTNYSQVGGTVGSTQGGTPITTDGGFDAGIPSDGGLVDGGVNCVENLVTTWTVTDNCNAGGAAVSGSVAVDTNNCTAVISFTTASSPCQGTVSGTSNAFAGSCVGANSLCTSSSIPGTISCTGSSPTCTISVCPSAGGCQ